MSDLNMGYLQVFIGPMYAGKTTALILQLTHFADMAKFTGNKGPLLINSASDTRDSTNIISSHNSSYKGLSDNIKVVSVKNLADADISDYNVIGIDEHHFFQDYAETVLKWKDAGKRIYSSGLVGDANQKDFGQIKELLPKIDKIVFLTAVCYTCLQKYTKSKKMPTPEILESMKAPFTKRLEIAGIQESQIDVGATNKYIPVCGKHI
jgi:thymidine kinase